MSNAMERTATDSSRTVTPPPAPQEPTAANNVKGQEPTQQPADAEKANAAPPATFTFPDGGLKAWSTVAGAWLILFVSFGYVNAFGVYQEYYQQFYIRDKTSFDVSWIGSFQLFLMFSMSSITGKLHDEGYTRILLLIGSIIYAVCVQMVSLAKEYYSIFLAQGLGMGLGIGIMFLPAIGTISHHFQKRRALANGIVVSGSSVGGIVFPIMLNKLFQKQGFGSGVRASGYLILGCLVIANLLINTRLPPRKKRPAHMQFQPDMKGIVTDVPYIVCNIGVFFIVLGIFYPFFFLQLFATVNGVDENLSFYSLAILNAASVFGRVLPNFLADYLGPLNMMIPCVAIASAFHWILLACGNTAGIICFAIFFGFFSGAYISLLPSVQAGFARNVGEIGVRIGLPFLLLSIGALIGSPIAGKLVGDGPDFHWWKASTFSGVTGIVGTTLITTARFMQAKRKGTGKV